MNLAIVGTAGRGPDGAKLPPLWRTMKAVTQIVVTLTKPTHLVSGSTAWADHLSVQAYLEGQVPNLTLHLPAEWIGHGFKETSSKYDTGRTSNWYHSLFSQALGIDSLAEIQAAIEKGATIKSGAGGFKERNTDIARQADVMLAFTFGEGAKLKDGGTLDSMTKFLARRDADDYTLAMNGAGATGRKAYHFDLNTKRLYSL